MSAPIKPFTIAVPDAKIEELKTKLSLATLPDERVGFIDNWDYGVARKDVKRLIDYWKDGYDWRQHEARLNKYPQFQTTINVEGFGDLEIHFVHQKSQKTDAIPLLFCHGWPGGFFEVLKLLPLLTEAREEKDGDPSFHVVAPSLPNFGFSEAVTKPGFGLAQYAEVCHKLMLQLGYSRYVTQGGDWGTPITRIMGVLYPDHVAATHINYVRADPPRLMKQPLLYLRAQLTPYTAAEKAGMARTRWFFDQGFGYNKEQSTKPHTLGFALQDSPVALLAWVYEKLVDWTDAYPWTDDEVLTWISVYAFSRSGPAASVRIYYEAVRAVPSVLTGWAGHNGRVKLGVSVFPRDLLVVPRLWAHTLGPVVFETAHDAGGHFAAFEKPEVLAGDLKTMFGRGGGAHSVSRELMARI